MNVERLSVSLASEFAVPDGIVRKIVDRVWGEVGEEIYRRFDELGDMVLYERRVLWVTVRIRVRDVPKLEWVLGKIVGPRPEAA